MWKGRLNYESAFAIVKRRRPQARPNDGFIAQLEAWGEKLASGTAGAPELGGGALLV